MNVISRLKVVASVSTIALSLCIAPLNVASAAENYSVTGVESWDTLNIRARPNARSAILGEIPANATGVVSTGEEIQNGRTVWTQVSWKGTTGWASKRYLSEDFSYKPVMQQPRQTVATTTTTTSIDRTGMDIYAASNTSGVYAGPVAGIDPAVSKQRQVVQQVVQQPVQQPIQQPARKVTQGGVAHSHPANQCTRSVSHTHPGGGNQHQHRYSCQGNARQPAVRQQQAQRPANNGYSHTHPRNQLTNAVTHAHPGGNANHQHNYGGQRRQPVRQQQVQRPASNGYSHTHPRNQLTNAVTHAHPGGNANHQHNYGGQRRQPVRQQQVVQQQVQRPASNGYSHTHPRNQLTNAVTHAHPGGNANHQHNYGGQRRQAVQQQAPAVRVNTGPQLITHIHPASPYNKETRHTHAGGATRHVHDFLMPRGATAKPRAQVQRAGSVAHTHPSNQLTNSVTHSHPNGGNQHNHSYGRR